MSSNTYIANSAHSFAFPFEGSWETAGVGYSANGVSDVTPNVGRLIPLDDLNGEQIISIGVIPSDFGYGGNGVSSPVFFVVMPAGLPQNFFDNVSVQFEGNDVITTFNTADVDLYSQNPVGGPFLTNWVWTITSGEHLFDVGSNTHITFNLAPPPPSLSLDAETVSDSEIDLTWTDSSSPTPLANSYSLVRDSVVIQTFANNVFSFQDTGLDPSTEYDYAITGESEAVSVDFRFQTASGVSPLNPIGGSTGQGWNNGNSSFGIAFGNLLSTPNPPVFLGNGVCAISYETASANANVNNHIDFIIAGSVAQDVFDTLSFVDGNGNTVILSTSTATFSTSYISGFSIWLWPAPDGNPFPPFVTDSYTVTISAPASTLYGPAFANATTDDPPMPVPVSFLAALNGDQFFTANGDLNIGGVIYTYNEDTLTPCDTYTDVTGTVLNPNPLIINTQGTLNTEIWTLPGQNTRARIMDSANVLQQDLDNIPGVPFIPQGLVQVQVINSIFSTDTANAASANAVNWVFKIANGAYGQANTDANAISNLIANIATLSTSTLTILSDNVTINVGNTINFQNTAFANISVTPYGNNAVNVAIFANGAVGSNTTNGSVTIGGTILQWAFYSHTEAGDLGPFTDDFPNAFPNGCVNVQLTAQGAAGATPINLSSFTKSSFTWFTGHGDSPTTGQYVYAVGY